jgi:hypothetical protein
MQVNETTLFFRKNQTYTPALLSNIRAVAPRGKLPVYAYVYQTLDITIYVPVCRLPAGGNCYRGTTGDHNRKWCGLSR